MTRNIWSDRVEKITTKEFIEGIETIARCDRNIGENEDGMFADDKYMQGWYSGLLDTARDLEKLLGKLDKKELEKLEKVG